MYVSLSRSEPLLLFFSLVVCSLHFVVQLASYKTQLGCVGLWANRSGVEDRSIEAASGRG